MNHIKQMATNVISHYLSENSSYITLVDDNTTGNTSGFITGDLESNRDKARVFNINRTEASEEQWLMEEDSEPYFSNSDSIGWRVTISITLVIFLIVLGMVIYYYS